MDRDTQDIVLPIIIGSFAIAVIGIFDCRLDRTSDSGQSTAQIKENKGFSAVVKRYFSRT
jgi:hypothetical protein